MALVQVLHDKHQRWGQITALKWVNSQGDGTLLFIGTARGRLAVYEWTSREVSTFIPLHNALPYIVKESGQLLLNESIFRENTPVEDLDFHCTTQKLAVASTLGEIRVLKLDPKGT